MRMNLITNIGIQFFTYDPSPRAIRLLHALSEFATDSNKLKAVWQEHDGHRTTRTIGALLQDENNTIRLNDCYIQSFTKHLSPELIASGVHEATAHLNISPDCEVWAHSSEPTSSGQPGIRRVLSGVRNLERCAGYHKPEIIPSVVQLTLRSSPRIVHEVLELYQRIVTGAWARISCAETLGTLDCGGEWLFFPTSGLNPNVKPIEVFLSSAGGELTRSDWPRWRADHNVSLEPRHAGSADALPQWDIHSLEPRKPLDGACPTSP
jgi:hypothetical protein